MILMISSYLSFLWIKQALVCQKGEQDMLEGNRYNKSNNCKGADHPKARFNNELAKEIREKYVFGKVGVTKLSHMYECGTGTIQCIIYGKTWKAAGGPIHTPLLRRDYQ
jgi:hypothetical protein